MADNQYSWQCLNNLGQFDLEASILINPFISYIIDQIEYCENWIRV